MLCFIELEVEKCTELIFLKLKIALKKNSYGVTHKQCVCVGGGTCCPHVTEASAFIYLLNLLGYCSIDYPGGVCEFDCITGPDIRSFCTPDGTWDPYPTCDGDVR